MIVCLADRVLGGEPQVLFHAQRILEAAVGKGGNGCVQIVQSLDHAGAFEFKYCLSDFFSVRSGKHKLRLAGAGYPDFRILVHISVCMTGDGDRLFPGTDCGMHTVYLDRRPEDGTIQYGTDRSVGAFPHFLQVVFLHPLGIGCNGCALHSHAVFQRCFRTVHCDLVIGLIPVFQSQVIIFCFQVHKGLQQLFLYLSPENPGHFIPVHLHQRRFHLNLAHLCISFICYAVTFGSSGIILRNSF